MDQLNDSFYINVKLMAPQKLYSDMEQLQSFTVDRFMDQLSDVYYPCMLTKFRFLTKMLEETRIAGAETGMTLMQKVKQEFECILQKEEVLVFPVLKILEQESKTTDCKLFKLTKLNYTIALSAIQQLKELLSAYKQEHVLHLMIRIKEMETDFIQLQKAKEKYLFSRFKSCKSSCKVYEQQ